MVVGLIGILKAGGAYVPMDTIYPKDRLDYMLESSQATVLLTQSSLLEYFAPSSARVVCIDRDWQAISAQSAENLSINVQPENVAYVIYTSGSTGKPKGVQIEHRALVNFMTSMRGEPGLARQDSLLAVTTLSFDIAGLEIYLPLLVGARLIIATQAATHDGLQLSSMIDELGVNTMQATPATYKLLIESGWQGVDGLKILCGGEALPHELANQLLDRCASLWNLFGPTETTIWSTLQQVNSMSGEVAIGHPIANTQCYVLDEQLRPTPSGVPGELYIGGAGLARGYMNDPDLSAEKFIANPFSTVPGERLYKTGDRVRHLSDGRLEFMSRIDLQVKVRGFRIELREIESSLSQHPAIKETVVGVMNDASGSNRLVAYYVAQGEGCTQDGLRRFLSQKLPEYMVPSAFIVMESLPLTPNGKINRKALRAPTGLRPDLETSFELPRNERERIIAGVWQQELQIEQVGIHDNFFDLGGNSLLLMRVHGKLQTAFNHDFSPIEMFRYPTVDSLAGYLDLDAGAKLPLEQNTDLIAERKEGKGRMKRRLAQRRR
jgi:amino acid adenylation domain-containing protein